MARADRRPAPGMTRQFVTPEGVDLGIRLADASTRAAAFIIDAIIMIVALVVFTIVLALGAWGMGLRFIQTIAIVWLLTFFALRNFYFILFEGGRRAATPGKRINQIRVMSRDGGGLSLDQIIARNLMREIEVFLPLSFLGTQAAAGALDGAMALLGLGWTLVFTFFPLFNRDRLRIGDLLAGTAVIHAPRRALLEDLVSAQDDAPVSFHFTREQLDAYGISELQRLEQVLRDTNEGACWVVARAIANRIGWTDELRDARPFLIAYYNGLRAHLEHEVLFGVRRADKTAVRRP